jgi:exosome complex component CSL4
MKNEIYTPGEAITTEEEYSAGKNTFVDDGVIKSKITGKAEFDQDKKRVSIVNEKKELITLIKNSMVVIDIVKAEEKGIIFIVERGQIPVRNISKNYVKNPEDYFKVGDYVRAKVSSADKFAVDLATNEDGLGIVVARCSKCKKPMEFSNEKLTCFYCGNSDKRKWHEVKEKKIERERNNHFNSRNNHRQNFRRN